MPLRVAAFGLFTEGSLLLMVRRGLVRGVRAYATLRLEKSTLTALFYLLLAGSAAAESASNTERWGRPPAAAYLAAPSIM